MNIMNPATQDAVVTTYHTAPHTPFVLIVEDDILLSKMYAEKFTIDGFFTIVVHDGESALETMKSKAPDCVLLDLHIPKIDGLDVVARAKAEMGTLPPILALTNIAEKDRREKALALGVREYLIKAMLTPEQVVQKVKQVLS